MKSHTAIMSEIEKLTQEYRKTNCYGQSVIGQIIAKLCWVADLNYNEFAKRELHPYLKTRK